MMSGKNNYMSQAQSETVGPDNATHLITGGGTCATYLW